MGAIFKGMGELKINGQFISQVTDLTIAQQTETNLLSLSPEIVQQVTDIVSGIYRSNPPHRRSIEVGCEISVNPYFKPTTYNRKPIIRVNGELQDIQPAQTPTKLYAVFVWSELLDTAVLISLLPRSMYPDFTFPNIHTI